MDGSAKRCFQFLLVYGFGRIAVGAISAMRCLPNILPPRFNSFLFNLFGGKGGCSACFAGSAAALLSASFWCLFSGNSPGKPHKGRFANVRADWVFA
jgi:hypothetical protein